MISRVPSLLSSQIMLGSITRSSRELLELQVQLATGQRVSTPSDDPAAASAVTVIDAMLEQRGQRLRNLDQATMMLGATDTALGELNDLLLEARTIASSQIGAGSDAETRATQAQVIDALLARAVDLGNRRQGELFLFGGSAVGRVPFEQVGGAIEYAGLGDGMLTDLGLSRPVPVTLSGAEAFGSQSARMESLDELTVILDGDERLRDLDGAIGAGIRPGSIVIESGAQNLTVDLTGAHTLRDALNSIQAALDVLDPGATIDLDPGGTRLLVTPASGSLTIRDLDVPLTAADLGIDATFGPGAGTGAPLRARITEATRLDHLAGVALGSIRLTNGGVARDVDLAALGTVGDFRNAVAALDLGLRVSIDDDGHRLRITNQRSGSAMSIGEVGGGTTATDLGLRTLDRATRLSDFNHGRGVDIVTGGVDPVTGNPDPARDTDFRVQLKDGTTFDVDLAGALDVGGVLDAINDAASGAGIDPSVFEARLAGDGNGIALWDDTDIGAPTSVAALNGSFAAADLGLEGSTNGAILTGVDRATVAVDGVFAHLIALRDALLANDERGITLAGERLDGDVTRATAARATVGVRAQTVDRAVEREETLRLQETSLRSELADLDFAEAAVRLSLVQQQLQAGLATTGAISSLSLLDFLR